MFFFILQRQNIKNGTRVTDWLTEWMSKLLFGIQGSGPRTRDDRLRGRLTPKWWKQKRRLSKLFENMNSIVFYISYPFVRGTESWIRTRPKSGSTTLVPSCSSIFLFIPLSFYHFIVSAEVIFSTSWYSVYSISCRGCQSYLKFAKVIFSWRLNGQISSC